MPARTGSVLRASDSARETTRQGAARPVELDDLVTARYRLVVVVSISERLHVFSFEEYAELAERSANRVEFFEGAILDMSGGSPRHSAICSNIIGILGAQLRVAACRTFDANLRVRSVAANRATYADVTVVCGELELDPADKTRQTVLNPTVLIEVLSPSTESDDRGPKLDCYGLIASVRTVILVAQDKVQVTVHERQTSGPFSHAVFEAGTIDVAAIACRLPLAEIYEDLPACSPPARSRSKRTTVGRAPMREREPPRHRGRQEFWEAGARRGIKRVVHNP